MYLLHKGFLKIPSCIRAPVEAHTRIRGKDLLVAYSIKRVIFSPTKVDGKMYNYDFSYFTMTINSRFEYVVREQHEDVQYSSIFL